MFTKALSHCHVFGEESRDYQYKITDTTFVVTVKYVLIVESFLNRRT